MNELDDYTVRAVNFISQQPSGFNREVKQLNVKLTHVCVCADICDFLVSKHQVTDFKKKWEETAALVSLCKNTRLKQREDI